MSSVSSFADHNEPTMIRQKHDDSSHVVTTQAVGLAKVGRDLTTPSHCRKLLHSMRKCQVPNTIVQERFQRMLQSLGRHRSAHHCLSCFARTFQFMVRRLAFPAPPPMVWSGRGGGGGLACAESGLAGWAWAAMGHREGRDLTQAISLSLEGEKRVQV